MSSYDRYREGGSCSGDAVLQFATALKDGKAEVRLEAANALGELPGIEGRGPAVLPLIEALDDSVADVVSAAVWALGELKVAEATPSLIEVVKTRDSPVRRLAAEALAKIGRPAICPLLGELRKWNDATDGLATGALIKIGAPAVEPLIEALGDEKKWVRRRAYESLLRIGAPAATALAQALESSNDRIRGGVASLLAGIPTVESVPHLITAVKTGDKILRLKAGRALAGAGEEAVEPLLDLLHCDETAVRRTAAWALVGIGKIAVEAAIRTFEKGIELAAAEAAWVLSMIDDNRAAEALERLRNVRTSHDDVSPLISVIVCTHNRVDDLKICLDSLEGLRLAAGRFEVLVVDNNSTDSTRDEVASRADYLPWLRYLFEPATGLSHARNRGIAEARGEIITFIDDDATVEPDFLIEIIKAFEEYPEVLCVGGRVWLATRDPLPPWLKRRFMGCLTAFELGEDPIFLDKVKGPYGVNMSFRREVFERFGLFDTGLGRIGTNLLSNEEIALLDPIKRLGKSCIYWPFAVVYHWVPESRISRWYIVKRQHWQGISDAIMLDEFRGYGRRQAVGFLWGAIKSLWNCLAVKDRFFSFVDAAKRLGFARQLWKSPRTDDVARKARVRAIPEVPNAGFARRFYVLRRRMAARLGIVPKDFMVQIQTVSTCNATCVFCPYQESWGRNNPGVMEDWLFDKVIDDLARHRLGKVCLYLQNEPLLDPKFIPRLRQARDSLNYKLLEVSTNASVLSEDLASELADALDGIPNEIWVSFHGVSPETYEKAMGLKMERALANVVGLLRLAERRNLEVIVRGAGRQLSDTAEESAWNFGHREYVDFWGRVVEENGLQTGPRINFFHYHDRSGNVAADVCAPSRRRSLDGFYCWRIDRALHVLYNGDVIICCNDYQREVLLGSLREQTVYEIFRSGRYREVRRQSLGMLESPDNFICKRCGCPGG